MMSDPVAQPVAELSPSLSQWQRLANIFTAPSKTFEDIRAGHTSWWLPFLLFVVIGSGLWTLVTYKVTWPQVVENSLHMAPKQAAQLDQLPAGQRAQQMKVSGTIQQYIWLLAPIWVLVMNLIAAGVLLGTINFVFGGRATYGRLLAVGWYAGLPGLIKLLIGILGLAAGVTPESFLPQNPAGTNPGYFLSPPPDTAIALWALMVALDVTFLWTLVLWSKGLAKVAGTKPSAGYTAVFGWWILYMVLSIGASALFS